MSAEWAEQPAVPAGAGIPGKILAAEREVLGWTVEQVADQLKLAVRQVIALEAGDYASLPSPAVVRGFVRAYAKVVKLDPAPLVALIALDAPEAGSSGGTIRREKQASFSEVRFPTNGKRAALPLGLIGAVVAVVAVGVAAWQFGLVPGSLLGGATPAATSGSASQDASVTVLPAPLVGGAGTGTTAPVPAQDLKPIQNSVPLISVPPPATVTAGAPAAGAPAGVGPADAAANAGAAAAPAAANALVVNVREDSWIDVRRARGGAPLVSRLVRGGSTETIEVTEPVILTVGKPGAVDATLRGAAVALPQVPGKTVARVTLK